MGDPRAVALGDGVLARDERVDQSAHAVDAPRALAGRDLRPGRGRRARRQRDSGTAQSRM